MTPQSHQEYAAFAKWCHWLVAALILTQYLLIEFADRAEHANLIVKQLGIVANHKSVGMTILLLAILRLGFRLKNPPPRLPETMPRWQITISHAMHVALYACLFALPITGWLMSSANAYSVSWFNLFVLPDLIAPNEQNAALLKTVHARASDLLAILAALHIAAALKHHWIDKDTVLTRMTSATSLSIGVVVLLISTVYWGKLLPTSNTDSSTANVIERGAPAAEKAPEQTVSKPKSQLPVWEIDYAKSTIKFTGEQAGAPFTGQWKAWEASLQFDSERIDEARFDVTIDISSVASNDEDRDQTILSAEFFDVNSFPTANYKAENFKTSNAGFVADGTLTIKGIKQAAPLTFTIEKNQKTILLKGQANLVRHQWDIGTGDWADPTWVGSDVLVEVEVHASL